MWENIKDRLPGIEETVIVYPFCSRYPDVNVGVYDGKDFYDNDEGFPIDVDYWMPLPKPPIEEDK